MILFVSGGARSGKSSYAEQRAEQLQMISGRQLIYVATATICDDEMLERITRHQRQRGTQWKTVETSNSLIEVLNTCQSGDVILIDCLTTWLDHALYQRQTSRCERMNELKEWSRICREKQMHLILVSNDVNEGVPSQYASVQEYIRELEVLHRLWIAECDEVIQVVAGIPNYWKEDHHNQHVAASATGNETTNSLNLPMNHCTAILSGIGLAFQFFSRIPIPFSLPWNSRSLSWALASFPLVGGTIGAVAALSAYWGMHYVPTWLVALWIVSVWVGLTGGLHIDGWMDTADAVASNGSVQRKWEIMEDPRVGSFAVLALLFLLAWKYTFIYSLLHIQELWITVLFIFIPAFCRFGSLLLFLLIPLAKEEGLAWEWKKGLTPQIVSISSIPLIVFCTWMIWNGNYLYWWMPLSFLLFFIFFGLWLVKQFKGLSGDLIGASIEGGELWCLGIVSIYIWFVML